MNTDVNVTHLVGGALVTTRAGNRVWRLIRIAADQPTWAQNTGDVIWDAELLFDASCENGTPKYDQVGIQNTILFDVLKLGLLWNQIRTLHEALEGWANDTSC
jgi:hypothetical protein